MARIILFGDSLTAGYNPEEMFTDELTRRVQAAFPELDVINAGIPGDAAEQGLQRIEEHVLKYKADETNKLEVVTVFFGVNDLALHRDVSVMDYQAHLKSIVEQIGYDKVIVFSAPYVNQRLRFQDRPLTRIEQFVEVAQTLAGELDVPFVNLLEIMMNDTRRDDWFQADGLHFSSYGYEELAKLFNQEIKKKREVL
ncbi:SGNH/GDSL hydrolase family protein [Vagococcus zengguangii]|uniref:Esterase n=1 Tax=Vagococcus zengguangii TaxID=2571750 RepID=A0A4D7CUA9_9ENTE|nr:GDSL-type esterase/lipase family protein [Vagococcus zengguangii]QCI86893.1 esterase [Vagococcus zengguangii]TLG80499.1 esterase [Vagococcus zengguangii]